MPIIFVSCSACLTNVSANIFVYEGVLDLLFACSPVITLNLETDKIYNLLSQLVPQFDPQSNTDDIEEGDTK